jgi:hypothetical protein
MVCISIVLSCYVFAFVAGLAVVTIKLRQAGAGMRAGSAQEQLIRDYYRSAWRPILWTVFKAALIAGTVLSPLAVLLFGSRL